MCAGFSFDITDPWGKTQDVAMGGDARDVPWIEQKKWLTRRKSFQPKTELYHTIFLKILIWPEAGLSPAPVNSS